MNLKKAQKIIVILFGLSPVLIIGFWIFFTANKTVTNPKTPIDRKNESANQNNIESFKPIDNLSLLEIQPKQTLSNEQLTQLTQTTEATKSLIINSKYPGYKNEIQINENNQVSLVKEVVDLDNLFKLKDYGYKSENATKRYLEDDDFSVTMYIYPLEGVAFRTHTVSEAVYEVWRFIPATINEIDETWGNNLEKEPHDHRHQGLPENYLETI